MPPIRLADPDTSLQGDNPDLLAATSALSPFRSMIGGMAIGSADRVLARSGPPRRLGEALARLAELEAELARLREGMVQSHRLATLGTLSGMIAHEYNNLMTPVICYAQMALANPEDAELTRKALERALGGAERASRICESLLGFSREEQGTPTASLRESVDEALTCLARPLSKDGIDLQLELPDLHLAIDSVSLQQVLLNLLLNARKAIKGRGGQLRISAELENQHIHLRIADNGPGIPPQILEHLFEPFVTLAPGSTPGTPGRGHCEASAKQGSTPGITAGSAPETPHGHAALPPIDGAEDDAVEDEPGVRTRRKRPRGATRHAEPAAPKQPARQQHPKHAANDALPPASACGKGTGLGLTVCHDLITAAGGQIHVTSQPGQGATFHIRLPLAGNAA